MSRNHVPRRIIRSVPLTVFQMKPNWMKEFNICAYALVLRGWKVGWRTTCTNSSVKLWSITAGGNDCLVERRRQPRSNTLAEQFRPIKNPWPEKAIATTNSIPLLFVSEDALIRGQVVGRNWVGGTWTTQPITEKQKQIKEFLIRGFDCQVLAILQQAQAIRSIHLCMLAALILLGHKF